MKKSAVKFLEREQLIFQDNKQDSRSHKGGKMKTKRKVLFLCLLVVTVAMVQNAGAALTSSYYDGFVYYDKVWEDGHLRGRIDFAVYDERSEYESVTGFDAPGDGKYVYAYQIFNDLMASDKTVTYFSILGLDESLISGMGTQDDGSSGKKPAEWGYTTTEGYWKWKIEGTNSYIYKGDHSWFLVYSSNNNWVKGNYDVKGPENEGELPQPEIPEPASMLVLLSAGGLMMKKRRKTPLSI